MLCHKKRRFFILETHNGLFTQRFEKYSFYRKSLSHTRTHTLSAVWGSFLTGNELMGSECFPAVNACLWLFHKYFPLFFTFFSHFCLPPHPTPSHTRLALLNLKWCVRNKKLNSGFRTLNLLSCCAFSPSLPILGLGLLGWRFSPQFIVFVWVCA